MAAMTTVLTEFSNNGNSRTCTTTGHTAVKPKLVIEKRRVPVGNQTMCEFSVSVIHATEDSEGEIITQKVAFDITGKYPVNGQSTDIDAALAIARDIVAGDEYANSITTQEWLS